MQAIVRSNHTRSSRVVWLEIRRDFEAQLHRFQRLFWTLFVHYNNITVLQVIFSHLLVYWSHCKRCYRYTKPKLTYFSSDSSDGRREKHLKCTQNALKVQVDFTSNGLQALFHYFHFWNNLLIRVGASDMPNVN